MSSIFSRNSRRVLCRCKLSSLLLASRRPHSYGRQFYRCPRWADGSNKCEFFRWADSPTDFIVDSDQGSTVSQPDKVARDSTAS